MAFELDLSTFWYWNKECKDYGLKGKGSIVLKERDGKKYRALLKCKNLSDSLSFHDLSALSGYLRRTRT